MVARTSPSAVVQDVHLQLEGAAERQGVLLGVRRGQVVDDDEAAKVIANRLRNVVQMSAIGPLSRGKWNDLVSWILVWIVEYLCWILNFFGRLNVVMVFAMIFCVKCEFFGNEWSVIDALLKQVVLRFFF